MITPEDIKKMVEIDLTDKIAQRTFEEEVLIIGLDDEIPPLQELAERMKKDSRIALIFYTDPRKLPKEIPKSNFLAIYNVNLAPKEAAEAWVKKFIQQLRDESSIPISAPAGLQRGLIHKENVK